jgi:small-conductance mechanosensitive channel
VLDKFTVDLIFTKFNLRQLISTVMKSWLLYAVYKLSKKLIYSIILQTDSKYETKVLQKTISKYILMCIAAFMFLDLVGFQVSHIALITGTLGVGIGFGLQKIAANIVSGITIIAEKKIRIGDLIYIKSIDEHVYVRAINLRSTILETFSGEHIILPNEIMTNEIIKNTALYSKEVKSKIDFFLNFEEDLEKVIDIAISVANANKMIKQDKGVSCRVDKIQKEQGVFLLCLRFWVPDMDGENRNNVWDITSDIIIALQKKFKENNINFAIPKMQQFVKTDQ